MKMKDKIYLGARKGENSVSLGRRLMTSKVIIVKIEMSPNHLSGFRLKHFRDK
jgi:hypothetical protein